MFSREIATPRSQMSFALRILSARVSSSRTSTSLAARRAIRRSNSDGVYGIASEFSSSFGLSPPRLKPEPMVARISCSCSPIAFAALCNSPSAASRFDGAMCACLPSVNAALFKISLRLPLIALATSATALSATLLKYLSLISHPLS